MRRKKYLRVWQKCIGERLKFEMRSDYHEFIKNYFRFLTRLFFLFSVLGFELSSNIPNFSRNIGETWKRFIVWTTRCYWIMFIVFTRPCSPKLKTSGAVGIYELIRGQRLSYFSKQEHEYYSLQYSDCEVHHHYKQLEA